MQKLIHTLQKIIILLLRWRLPRKALQIAVRLFAPRHRIGVSAIVMDAQKGVLLLNHVFHPSIPWGVPGGWLDAGESPFDGAKRELWEETGLTAVGGTLIHMRRDKLPDHLAIAFLMEVDAAVDPDQLALSKEIVSAAWFNLADLPKLTPFVYESVLIAAEKLQQQHSHPEHL